MNLLKTLFSTAEVDILSSSLKEATLISEEDQLGEDAEADRAVVTRRISPDSLGRVKFQGTWWRAGSDRALILETGTLVRVVGRQRSNILIVEPISAASLVP